MQEWTNVDKTGWGEGPWNEEPDKIQWVDAVVGLDCLMVRGPAGSWCGYVGVPREHPVYGMGYDEVDVEVHGGLTYAATCQEGAPEGHGICHVPEPGRPHDIWWLGFDTAHAWDYMPAHAKLFAKYLDLQPSIAAHQQTDIYRDRQYVTGQVAILAQQLAKMA